MANKPPKSFAVLKPKNDETRVEDLPGTKIAPAPQNNSGNSPKNSPAPSNMFNFLPIMMMKGMMQHLQQVNASQKRTCDLSGCRSYATSNVGGEKRAGRFCKKHIILGTAKCNGPKPPGQYTEKALDEPKPQKKKRMCKKRSPDVNPANSGTVVECNDPKPPGQSAEKSSDEPKPQTRMCNKISQSTEKSSDEPKPQIRMCNQRSPDINPANKTKEAIRKTLKRKHVDQATNLLPKVFEHTEEIDEGVAPSSGLSDCAAPSSKTRLASVKPDRRPRHFGNGAKGASDAADSNRLSDISNVATKQVELTSNCDCHLKQSVRQVHQQLQQHSAGQQQQPIVDHRMSSAPWQHHHQSPLPGANMATSQMPHHEGKPPVYASDLWVHHPSHSAPPPRSHITPHQEVAHHVPAVYVPIFYGVSGVISNLQSLLPPPHPFHHGRELVYYPHFTTAAGSFPPPVVLS